MNDTLNAAITRYYDTHQSYYTRFWSPHALHYGLWYEETRSLSEAIENTDARVLDALRVTPDDDVLDAGCGVGGTSTFIAERTGARVEGITLSSVQLRIARERAAHLPSVNFSLQDFTCTTFDSGTFSKLFGIESVCYAHPKMAFLQEAYRLLRPGSRIAIIDTFLTKDHLTSSENRIYQRFIKGWAVPDLPTQSSFADAMINAGFVDVQFCNLQENIWPSVRRVFLSGLLTGPINLCKSRFRLAPENLSALYQKPLFEKQLAIYGLFVAEKSP